MGYRKEWGEWLAITSESYYTFPKRREDVTYSDPFGIDESLSKRILQAYEIPLEKFPADKVARTSPKELLKISFS